MDKKLITFGEVMMRLSPPGYTMFSQASSFDLVYGGGEANVAISCGYLGMKAAHVTRFPDNALGKAATQFLRKHWLGTKDVIYGDNMLGKYFLQKGAVHRSSEVIYEREGSAFSLIKPDMINWEEVLKGADWFHWTGITPAISEGAAMCCLEAIKTANKMGIKVSGDINSRQNMWKYGKTMQEVMPELVKNTDIVITSSRGIKEMFGLGEVGVGFSEAAKELMNTFPRIEKVVGKTRKSISASHQQIQGKMWTGKKYIKADKLDVTHVIDRVGTGDAFASGIIFGLLYYQDDDLQALNFATAACALKHTVVGDVNMVSLDNVLSLMKGDTSGKIKR
ncbi:2-dehydro-3-deoxygluconokinase [Polaribacter reichenbachii]|uniref:2-dehydro-3-deoxygluconokinase n=1 Tax=Polaribacter reichenbachii TaxID=996801 RepID=A0A1B8TUJ4_9FLAO|nr:sugar kinase [Polaribacter reichenbachii]APZ45633.1 2-dehydro-3-deoxygluconokinase [Polaribacter reichenbachii]AUC19495.1 2-dehydro-3-deoxygluconokinase [Polaribacter reichenbachii]OBY63351.1 2-dehydro-3-deoxygluconokinase [Polaribacter reichenbachii]